MTDRVRSVSLERYLSSTAVRIRNVVVRDPVREDHVWCAAFRHKVTLAERNTDEPCAACIEEGLAVDG